MQCYINKEDIKEDNFLIIKKVFDFKIDAKKVIDYFKNKEQP